MFRTRNKLLLFVFYSAIKKSDLTDEMLNSIKKDWIVNSVLVFYITACISFYSC